jgi:hypothetical protein
MASMASALRLPGLLRATAAPVVFALLSAGCHSTPGGPTATASDEWTRSYPLTPGGEVQITNRNGPVTVTAAEGAAVDVRVVRTVKAPTETAAKDLLPKVEIREDVGPDHVGLQTEGIDGILINVSWTLQYHVRAPETAIVRVRSSNGAVQVSGFSGRVIATSTNGGLTVSDLAGGAELRSTNGNVRVDVARIGADLIEVRSTNGQVHATLPADANANLLATTTNGRVTVDSLSIEPQGEQTPRRARGRLGSGGTPIELTATNGNITVTAAK